MKKLQFTQRFLRNLQQITSSCNLSNVSNSDTFIRYETNFKSPRPSVTSYLGQPSAHTHPHLIKPDETTQGITKAEYDERRQKLMFNLKHENNGKTGGKILAIFPASSIVYSAPDVPYYPLQQESNFFYLTGYCEPESFLVIHSDMKNGAAKSILFVAPNDPQKELWEGPRAGLDGALQLTGVVETGYLEDLKQFLNNFCGDKNDINVYYDLNFLSTATSRLSRTLFSDQTIAKLSPRSPYRAVHQLRWIKSAAERALMRRAADASANAFVATMKFSKFVSSYENQLVAKLDLEARLSGAQGAAYPPVVAGGDRANTIHYLNADQKINPGELVLVDSGCQYGGYCSDITRCWPVSGHFTNAQLELYEALLEVQVELLHYTQNIRGFSLRDLYFKMIDLLGDQLFRLGIVSKSEDRRNVADKYCPHHVSHYLGLDVHDTETVSKAIPVQPGVVITVEPGLYFRSNDLDIPARFRGIGLRIEDDVLITETGAEVLSEKSPKSVRDIEMLMVE